MLAGVCNGAAESDFCGPGLTAAGQFDTTFNGTGSVISPVAAVGATLWAWVAVQADGKDRGGWGLRRCRVQRPALRGALHRSWRTGYQFQQHRQGGDDLRQQRRRNLGGQCCQPSSRTRRLSRAGLQRWGQPDVLQSPATTAMARWTSPSTRRRRRMAAACVIAAVSTTGSSTANAIMVQPDQKIVQVDARQQRNQPRHTDARCALTRTAALTARSTVRACLLSHRATAVSAARRAVSPSSHGWATCCWRARRARCRHALWRWWLTSVSGGGTARLVQAAAATVGIGFATAFAVTQQVDGRILLAGTALTAPREMIFVCCDSKPMVADLSLGGTGRHVTR